jgi:hypothetical protein
VSVQTYQLAPCQSPSARQFPCQGEGIALGGLPDDYGLICSQGLVATLEAKGGVTLGGNPSSPKKISPTESVGGLALGGNPDSSRVLERSGGLQLGGGADQFSTVHRPGGVLLGGASNPPFPLGTRHTPGGPAWGGSPDPPSWINPAFDISDAHELGSHPSSISLASSANDLIVIWVTSRNTSGTGIDTPSVTTSGYTGVATATVSNLLSISLWYGQFSTAQTSVSLSWLGSSDNAVETGYMAFKSCPSATLDFEATATGNSNEPIINTTGTNFTPGEKIELCVGTGNNTEYTSNPWSGMSGHIGVGTGYSGWTCGSYVITNYIGGYQTYNTTLFTGNWACVFAVFRI